jgi:hypothetical protein
MRQQERRVKKIAVYHRYTRLTSGSAESSSTQEQSTWSLWRVGVTESLEPFRNIRMPFGARILSVNF